MQGPLKNHLHVSASLSPSGQHRGLKANPDTPSSALRGQGVAPTVLPAPDTQSRGSE